jgi:hypothetical protein
LYIRLRTFNAAIVFFPCPLLFLAVGACILPKLASGLAWCGVDHVEISPLVVVELNKIFNSFPRCLEIGI